ncbi:MAG: L,D-transpeptidase family protein [Rufibacter sp.]
MKRLLLLFSLATLLTWDGFKATQLKFDRVQTAYQEKQPYLEKLLAQKQLTAQGLQLYLRAFKLEKTLEVWARNNASQPFKLLISYPFCSVSGVLGPKRKEGDGQIPEGFYTIDRFNPQSNFYLSLGINYPNAADKALTRGNKLGGDIFLHGDCVTVGCIPLTDDKIKELYVLAVEAYQEGQTQIPVHIFPCRFNSPTYANLQKQYAKQPSLLKFWKNLQGGYAYFEQKKTVPAVVVSTAGEYVLK